MKEEDRGFEGENEDCTVFPFQVITFEIRILKESSNGVSEVLAQ